MFDFSKFLGWIKDGLFESLTTWQTYKEAGHSWKATAMQLTAPLVVLWGLFAVILGSVFGTGNGFSDFLGPIVSSIVWFGLGSFIASFLAAKFGGTNSFDQAFAALTFASIPVVIGSVLGTLPWVGVLLVLAGLIWTIMLLWQALPVFLDITLDRRTGHFFATLGLSIVSMLVLGALLGAIGLGGSIWGDSASERYSANSGSQHERNASTSDDDLWSYGDSDGDSDDNSSGRSNDRDSGNGAGMFGFGREIDYLEQAENDRYTPPLDGQLDEEQVERALKFLAAAGRLRDASTESLEKLGDENNEPSLGDLFKGVKGLVSAGTAETQAVKSGGGNWAEHEWVKKQLFEAKIHQDLNETTTHNYELYQKHEEALNDWL